MSALTLGIGPEEGAEPSFLRCLFSSGSQAASVS
jgi:hypothetical protein